MALEGIQGIPVYMYMYSRCLSLFTRAEPEGGSDKNVGYIPCIPSKSMG